MSEPLSVLIVEDDPHVLLGCQQALTLEDIPSVGVGSAEEALTRLALGHIGAVVTDAILTKAQAHRLAVLGHDGLARAILPAHLPAGARATVQLLPDNALTGLLARGQIRLLSLLHYIY